MTENEAKKHLELCKKSRMFIPKNDVLDIAIKALEEIRQYRAIGTVEELQKMKGVITDFPIDCGSPISNVEEIWNQLKKYLAIGTIEEFKALKEKNTPKELAEHNFQDEPHHYLCPSCRSIVRCTQNYCDECGQALET